MLSLLSPSAVLIALLAVFCFCLLLAGFRYGLRRSSVQPGRQRRAIELCIVVAALWFLLVGLLARAGFFSNFAARPPRLLFALLLPAVALAVVSFSSRNLREALRHTPVSWLFFIQAFRILVELLLWRGYKTGAIPVQMTFEGRNFDILAGLSAPFAGWLWQRTRNRTLGIAWNLAGMALLLNIVVIAVLSMPTPLRMFVTEPANTLLTQFPFIYLPAILVPIGYTAHILSLRQLISGPAEQLMPVRTGAPTA